MQGPANKGLEPKATDAGNDAGGYSCLVGNHGRYRDCACGIFVFADRPRGLISVKVAPVAGEGVS